MTTTAIWWIRRDLRLKDNQALHAALNRADAVLPVFILDENLWNSEWVGEKRLAFMLGGLRALDEALRERGSRLILRQGEPLQALTQLMEETGAAAIFAEADYSPYARARDEHIAEDLPLAVTEGVAILPPGTVCKKDGGPYQVYTPFKRTWLEHPLPQREDILPAPDEIPTPEDIESLDIPTEPTLPEAVPFTPGERAAEERLTAFVMGDEPPIYRYDELRDRTDLDGTSRISPYLRFGMVSARRAAAAANYAMRSAPDKPARENAFTWLSELIWRDFYLHVLYHFPHARTQNFNETYDPLEWDQSEGGFQAWCEGRTGYPIVDAAMRQLTTIGWMHNRARMIVASFLTKDLLIDWRRGERFFMQHLVDGDPASNNGGWQWAAGTGTDAQPYFRIFNPTSQAEKHDPDGVYIRRYIPALENVPDKFIHEPWKMDEETQQEVGCIIGEDYPAPIVDHKEARQRTLDAYKAAREASGG